MSLAIPNLLLTYKNTKIMKTIKSVLIGFILTLGFFNLAVANNSNPIIKVENKTIYLSLENVSEQTSVKILDEKGQSLIEETVGASTQFESVFNLEVYPLGTYTLVVQSAAQETLKEIKLTRDGISIEEKSTVASIVPTIRAEKRGRLQLNFANPSRSVVSVVIFDAQGRRCYQNTLNNQALINESLNLKQLPAGRYTVSINDAHGVFTQSVRLR